MITINRLLFTLGLSLIVLLSSPAAYAGSWQHVYDKPGVSRCFIAADSIALNKNMTATAISRYEFTAFGAGFFRAIMQAIQKNQPEFAPNADLSNLTSTHHKIYINITADQYAVENTAFYDAQDCLIYQWSETALQWKTIEPDSDEEQLARFIIGVLAAPVYQQYAIDVSEI